MPDSLLAESMRRMRWMAFSLCVLLVVAACTGGVGDPSEVSLPGSSATAPVSSVTSSTVSELADTNSGSGGGSESSLAFLFKVDSSTLEPLPGFEPIGIGMGGLGEVSPSGNWLLISTWNHHSSDERLLIDTESWEIVSRSESSDSPMTVTDDGTILAQRKAPNYLIQKKPLASDEWVEVAEMSSGEVLPHGLSPIDDHRLGGLGTSDIHAEALVPAILIVIDLSEGSVSKFTLPTVLAGSEPTDVETGDGHVVSAMYQPAVAWAGDRAFVVHAAEDVVTEIDLVTGETTDHSYGAQVSVLDRLLAWLTPVAQAKGGPNQAANRSVIASADGEHLYVSGHRTEVHEDSSGTPVESTTPLGVDVVSTETWSIETTLDIPVGNLTTTPDGSMLFGTGSISQTTPDGQFISEGTGVYIIETSDLEYVHVDQESDQETRVDVSSDGRHAYLTYGRADSEHTYVDVVDLTTYSVIASHRGIRLQVWGSAGVTSQWTGGLPTP